MAIKCVLDSLDGVHEDLIPHYVKKADKFELQLEGARTQGDVDRLQASLVQEREFSKGLKAFKEACGEHKAEEVAALLQSIPELKVMAEAGGSKNESGNGANVFLQNNMQVRTAWINANQDKPGVVQNAMTQAGLSHAAQTYVAKK